MIDGLQEKIATVFQVPSRILFGEPNGYSSVQAEIELERFFAHHRNLMDALVKAALERVERSLRTRKSKGWRRHVRRMKMETRRATQA